MKYWDIKPRKKKNKFKPKEGAKSIEDMLEELKKYDKLKPNKEIVPYQYPNGIIPSRLDIPCMHKACPTCHGTGQGPFGTCVHMISCPCPSCTPWMMVSGGISYNYSKEDNIVNYV